MGRKTGPSYNLFEFDMVTPLERWDIAGVGCVLVVTSDRARYTRITLKRDGSIRLTVPRGVAPEAARRFLESKRRWIQRRLEGFRQAERHPVISRAEARRVLTDRVAELARAHGFTYNKVFVKSQRTLWGSCSGKNNINLNVSLLHLPEELRDYVILHELVHTRHKNHSPAFWREMNRLVGDGKRFQRRLRAHKLPA
jgi:predicted metal-dependent hydrolase